MGIGRCTLLAARNILLGYAIRLVLYFLHNLERFGLHRLFVQISFLSFHDRSFSTGKRFTVRRSLCVLEIEEAFYVSFVPGKSFGNVYLAHFF